MLSSVCCGGRIGTVEAAADVTMAGVLPRRVSRSAARSADSERAEPGDASAPRTAAACRDGQSAQITAERLHCSEFVGARALSSSGGFSFTGRGVRGEAVEAFTLACPPADAFVFAGDAMPG